MLAIALRYISLAAVALCVLNSGCVRTPEHLTVSAEDDRLGDGVRTVASRRYDGVSRDQVASRAIPGLWTVSAEECGPHCDPRTHPSQYSDPRCESMRSGPRLERDELRCDPRVQRRGGNHAPPIPPSQASSSTEQTPPIRSVDGQQSRPAERDVGFDDAFVTRGNAQQAGGEVGADDAHRAPRSRR